MSGARSDFDEAVRLNPHSQTAHINRGRVLEERRDWDGALAEYEQAVRLADQSGWGGRQAAISYNNRGALRLRKGDVDGALADYTAAIRRDPQFSEPWYNRGNIYYFRRHDWEKAAGDLEQALKLAPPGWAQRASAQGMLDDARRRLKSSGK